MLLQNSSSKIFNIKSSFFICSLFFNTLFSSPNLAMMGAEEVNNLELRGKISSSVRKAPFFNQYMQEIAVLKARSNRPADPSLQYVFILSGRYSYLKNVVDGPEFEDREDDYNRIELGIKVAKDAVAAHLKKSEVTLADLEAHGPLIIYNGRKKHNEDLRTALETGVLSHYPKSKFYILDLEEESSRGQFQSIKKDIHLSHTSVGIITHAYHFPRIARMMGSKWYPFGEDTKVFFYLVDRDFKAPDVIKDMEGEIDRIPRYIENGDLKENIPQDIVF